MLKSCRKDGVLVAANLLWIMVKIGCWKDWKTGKNRERIWRINEEHEEHLECGEEQWGTPHCSSSHSKCSSCSS